ncbi:SigB/SigF/SigG family RNA polymerase sigma factor [Nocardia inohanensis]|uniref:SigB/SigF/SigG family RNA polymerase sigma factor n=1 Tax=Nocardia inohanensis TaxID=209246 RepID=UPI000831BC4E|nr:SigB/SigF/SigG family RNA polymerase sigma factor [Nocardia inohanensis]
MSDEHAARSETTVDGKGSGDSYDNIEPWLKQLATLADDSDEYARLRDEIIRRCLPLGEHIARRYTGRGVEYEDLAQIAAVGVVLAVDRFDPANGASFLSFAIPTVTGEVKRYFRDSTWAVRVPRRIKEIQQRLTTVVPELAQRLGHQPTARELAAHLEVDLFEITQALIASNCYTTDSLDAPAATSGEQTLAPIDRMATEDPGYALIEDSMAAGPLLATLGERERTMLIMRYGQNKTQSEIARVLGVSQMHVSRLLARTLVEIRERALQSEGRVYAA